MSDIILEVKVCGKCKTEKPIDAFYRNKSTLNGRYGWCKKCCSKYHKEKGYSRTNKAKLYNKKYHLRKNYGLTLVDFDKMVENQNGVCAICGKPEIIYPRLCVDHNHKTGKMRGLLCRECNIVLGFFEKDPNIGNKIKKYLEKY